MKMSSRHIINVATFLVYFVGSPIYCLLKLEFEGRDFPLAEIMAQPTTAADMIMGFAMALMVVYVPDLFAQWLRNKFPNRKQNLFRYFIMLLFLLIFIFMIVYFFKLISEMTVSADFPFSLFLDFFLLCEIIAIFSTSLIESNYLSEQWEKEVLKRELLEKEHLQAKFEVLKSQINPHFLFNSFNTLAELINWNQQLATTFVQELSGIFRFVLENRSNEIVELNDELKLFKSYLFLMQIRFGDNLRIHWNVPEDKTQFGIIPLTSQMLLENAVKHNIISKDKPLNIYVELDEKNTLIFRNDLQKKIDSTSSSTKTGLQNIINRYKYVADETIDIIETAKEFIVKVPLIKIEQL
jgi:sensor histidine kinase YesM